MLLFYSYHNDSNSYIYFYESLKYFISFEFTGMNKELHHTIFGLFYDLKNQGVYFSPVECLQVLVTVQVN